VIYIGMDVHQKSTTFCLFDPWAAEEGPYRWVTQPTTEEAIRRTLAPLGGQCRVAFEVGTQAQWIAAMVRPLAVEVQVANPSRIPWLFRDGRKNDRLDARKLVTRRTQSKNQVRAILRAFGLGCPYRNLWPQRGRYGPPGRRVRMEAWTSSAQTSHPDTSSDVSHSRAERPGGARLGCE